MKYLLLLILTFTWLAPSFAQSYQADWQYQLQLNRTNDGDIDVSYSKEELPATTTSSVEESPKQQNLNPLTTVKVYGPLNTDNVEQVPWMNNNGRVNVVNVVLSSNNGMRNPYQMTVSYFMYMNSTIFPMYTGDSYTNYNMSYPEYPTSSPAGN